MNIGYDLYVISKNDVYELLKFAKKNNLKIIHLNYKDDECFFYVPTYQRWRFRKIKIDMCYQGTYGFLKYILLLLKNSLNIIGILSFITTLFVCSYLIFDVKIIGTIPCVNKQIKKQLINEDVRTFSKRKSFERLNDILMILKHDYKEQAEYVNVYQIGSVFYVEYTKRKQDQIEKEDYRNLYARKDGMIQKLDVEQGNIKVKLNDYVKKGDLLVENTVVSTDKQTKIIPVKGHVYAYTFNEYEASINRFHLDQAEVFYELLLKIRSQLPANAWIDKENVLQINRNHSKITLKMEYTLIEDIALKGDQDERSHETRGLYNR